MAALDRVKEEVAYLKFWQAIAVATVATLAGWMISAVDAAPMSRIALAAAGLALLSFVALISTAGSNDE